MVIRCHLSPVFSKTLHKSLDAGLPSCTSQSVSQFFFAVLKNTKGLFEICRCHLRQVQAASSATSTQAWLFLMDIREEIEIFYIQNHSIRFSVLGPHMLGESCHMVPNHGACPLAADVSTHWCSFQKVSSWNHGVIPQCWETRAGLIWSFVCHLFLLYQYGSPVTLCI